MPKYSLPPKLQNIRRHLARSHNLRVLFVVVVSQIVFWGAYQFHSNTVFYTALALVFVWLVAGIVYIFRRAYRHSVELGFVCPRCDGPLYDGGDNRLGHLGQCPRCKQFIIEELQEKYP